MPNLADYDTTDVDGRLSRRGLLRTGGAIGALSVLTACGRNETNTAPPNATATFLSAHDYAILHRLSDLMIPRTDTPGAVDAGVPQKLDMMMREWASEETRQHWRRVLQNLDDHAMSLYGDHFADLGPAKAHVALRTFDRNALNNDDHHYRDVKYIVLEAFYHSEVGATQELRFELVPGTYRGCVPLSEIGRAWAT